MPDLGRGSKLRAWLQTGVVILVLLFLVIDRIVVPQVSVIKSAETAAEAAAKVANAIDVERRLTRLEAGQDYIKAMLDKIDHSLTQHMAKEK